MTGKQIASHDVKPVQPAPIMFDSADDLENAVSPIVAVDGPSMNDLAELEKFMNEPVKMMIMSSDHEHAERFIHCAVNGEAPLKNADGTPNFWLPRGFAVTVKRKFVALLARTKKTNFRQDFSQPTNQAAVNTLLPSRGCAYPIQLLSDDNPNGPRFMQKWLEE